MINTPPLTRPVSVWYGGTFDPPHRGHQDIVRHLSNLPGIEQVIVTPAWLNPFKNVTHASAGQRLEWVHRVFDDPKVVIDAGEIEAGHSVYTADTLERLDDRYDIRFIAIGADNLDRIETWHAFDRLNARYAWLVFDRDTHTKGYEKLRECRRIPLDVPVSSTHIRSSRILDDVDPRIAHDVQTLLTKGTL